MSQQLDHRVTVVISDLGKALVVPNATSLVPSLPPEDECAQDAKLPAPIPAQVGVQEGGWEDTQERIVETQNLQRRSSPLINLFAGSLAGAMAKTTIAPLDRTKINFQVTQQRYSMREALLYIQQSYTNHGLRSLWRGNTATMTRILPYSGLQFLAHEEWKKVLHVDQAGKDSSVGRRFLAGSLAGVVSQTVVYPLDMARARMAVTSRKIYPTLGQAFKKIWAQEGPLTLYRGLTPTILGIIPYAGTSFTIYGKLKYYHKTYTQHDTPNPLERCLFGAISGLAGQSSSYPLDIVRRRMQTAPLTGNGNTYKTIIGTLSIIYKQEGLVHGLYKGLSLNWVKGPIATGISFATFDTVKEFLEQVTR